SPEASLSVGQRRQAHSRAVSSRAPEARRALGQGRRRQHGGPAPGAALLPLLLRPPAFVLKSACSRSNGCVGTLKFERLAPRRVRVFFFLRIRDAARARYADRLDSARA